jgi:hypothetical protein
VRYKRPARMRKRRITTIDVLPHMRSVRLQQRDVVRPRSDLPRPINDLRRRQVTVDLDHHHQNSKLLNGSGESSIRNMTNERILPPVVNLDRSHHTHCLLLEEDHRLVDCHNRNRLPNDASEIVSTNVAVTPLTNLVSPAFMPYYHYYSLEYDS